ncbi:MAG: hypothetical protein ABI778_04390 [Ignavibacteriota bacterium]
MSKLQTLSSFCANCGCVTRWEVQPDDPMRDHEMCKECAPWAARLCSTEVAIKKAELALIEFEGKATAHARAQIFINRERIVEAETTRRVAREKLFAIINRQKKQTAETTEKN